MELRTRLNGNTYQFSSVKDVLAKASELKSGDALAGLAASSTIERIAAKRVLSNLTVHDLYENPSVPYETDSVSRIITDDINPNAYAKFSGMTIGELREWIMLPETSGDDILFAGSGMTSEAIAAVSKLMGNLDLVYAGNKIRVKKTCNTTIGEDNVLACRLQPNHPIDSPEGVTAVVLEGLSYGMGDALIGLNPAIDTEDSTLEIWNTLAGIKERYEIPTQICVLSHVTTQMRVLQSGKGKADLCFQSIAGSEKAINAFGISAGMLSDAKALFSEEGSAKGPNVMYFETGQASELSSDAHFDTDQQTMECRCYGLARHYDPFIVNTVVGFMGPEYIYDTKQLLRAGLEDVFCGHMHGLAMGCDVCYTNHMPVDQNDSETLLMLLANSGCHYVMGLPQADDIMLMYQSTGFHDVAAVRELYHKLPIREFELWLRQRGLWENGRLTQLAGDPTIFI